MPPIQNFPTLGAAYAAPPKIRQQVISRAAGWPVGENINDVNNRSVPSIFAVKCAEAQRKIVDDAMGRFLVADEGNERIARSVDHAAHPAGPLNWLASIYGGYVVDSSAFVLASIKAVINGSEGIRIVPNPLLPKEVRDKKSPMTEQFLKGRLFAGGVVGALTSAGGALKMAGFKFYSPVTVVKDLGAAISSVRHAAHLGKIRHSLMPYRVDPEVAMFRDMLKHLRDIKNIKATIRFGDAGLAVLAMASLLTSLGLAGLTSAAALSVISHLVKVEQMDASTVLDTLIAMKLHAMYLHEKNGQVQEDDGTVRVPKYKGMGPAERIIQSLVDKKTLWKAGQGHEWRSAADEPGFYMMLRNKLSYL